MSETHARTLVAIVATLIAAALAALLLGDTAVHVVLTAGLLWLIWDRAALAERIDQAWDTADQAIRKAEAIENHLTGLEPPGTGRHASNQPQSYRALRRTAPQPPPAAAA